MTKGRVCNVKLLLSLASAVSLGSESRGTHVHILLSPICCLFPYLLSSEKGSPFILPGIWLELELAFVLRPTDSRPSSWYRTSLWGPWPDIIFLIFSFVNCFVVVPRAPSLTRGRVCSLQCNCWLVRSLRTSNHTLPFIWDCVPVLSPLTTRRDYGGNILTRLHTGCSVY
jgi:hypothetical protein